MRPSTRSQDKTPPQITYLVAKPYLWEKIVFERPKHVVNNTLCISNYASNCNTDHFMAD